MEKLNIDRRDLILLENLVELYGKDVILNEISKKGVIGGLASLALGVGMGLHNGGKDTKKDVVQDEPNKIEHVVNKEKRDNPYGMSKADYELFKKKVKAVKSEIERVFGKRNIPMDKLAFSPEYMVYQTYIHDFDLPLLISQSRLETGFGTEGVGKKCNSLFSIGAYDKDPTRVKYASLDDSIEPYIKTVKKNYLLSGKKTVDDLLKDNGYVNGVGNRYASNTNYEKQLRQIRDQLIKNYPIMVEKFIKN